MGRPRKRRREGAGNTEATDGDIGAHGGRAVGVADVGLQDLNRAIFSGNEPGFGIDGSHLPEHSFEGHGSLQSGAGIVTNLPSTEAFSFDFPEGLASNPEQDFPSWDTLQDLGQPSPAYADVFLQSQSSSNVPDELDGNNDNAGPTMNGCSCLSKLYSMLAKFQSLPEPSFPFSMGGLRSAAALSRDVVACDKCSQTYNTALQNSMLLGTLVQLLIYEYTKLLKHIDEKAKRTEKTVFRFGDPSSYFDSRHTGLPDCPMAINVDLNGDEWRTLARKAVGQEIIGNSQNSCGLIGLVQAMKDRQITWRARFSDSQCTAFHGTDHKHSAENPDHICAQVIHIDNLKKCLEALGL